MNIKKLVTIFLCVIATFMVGCISYAKGWTEIYGDWYFLDANGDKVTESIKTSQGFKYYLDEEGKMVRDYILENYNGGTYYFNDEGVMVSNTWVAVDPSQVTNPIDDGPTVYLYYFGPTGKAYKAVNDYVKKTIDGKKYLFNSDGLMLSGWINTSGEMFTSQDFNDDPFLEDFIFYAGDETDGVLKEGWYEYTDGSIKDEYYKRESIWFYFNPNNNKKVRYDGTNNRGTGEKEFTTKKINGQTYAFDENGVMLIGWEAEPATKYFAENKIIEGQMAKKQWVYAIPPDGLEFNTDYADEVERWFYASNSGDIVKDRIKKINGEDYVFDKNGIMKSSLVVVDRANRTFVAQIDVEATDGKNFLVDRIFVNKDTEEDNVFMKETQMIYYFIDEETNHLYGAKKIGNINLAFADKDYVFVSEKNGEREGYKSKEKKFYQHGLSLMPEPMIEMGLILEKYAYPAVLEEKEVPTKDPSDPGYLDEKEKCDRFNSSRQRIYNTYRNPDFVSKKDEDGNETDLRELLKDKGYNEYYVSMDPSKYGPDDENPDTGEGAHYMPIYKVIKKDGKKITKANVVKKDKNGNYWLIGNDSNFIKIVSVPVKYSKSTGWMFRSEFNEKNKTKTMYKGFGITDAYGRTVSLERQDSAQGYDVTIDEQYCLNFGLLDN